MTAPHEAPTLDEQIAWIRVMARSAAQHRSWFTDILASLERLRAIENAKGMPKPAAKVGTLGGINPTVHGCVSLFEGDKLYGPDLVLHAQHLQDRLNRMEIEIGQLNGDIPYGN